MDEKCCSEILEKSVAEKFCTGVLEESVVEHCRVEALGKSGIECRISVL